MIKPRILGLDIETFPATAYVWGLFDQNIGLNQLIKPGRIAMVGAKWLGDRRVFQWDERKGARHMLGAVHTLLSEADAVVTYNGNRFDLPRLNGAMIEAGLPSLPPITSIDLLKTVKKMGLQSNKLAFAAPFVGVGDKMDAGGFELWTQCMAGDAKAWAKMYLYNARDVRLTERLYVRLLPHIATHPRLRIRPDKVACRVCGSHHVQFRGTYATLKTRYDRIQCQKCGTWDKIPQGRKK